MAKSKPIHPGKFWKAAWWLPVLLVFAALFFGCGETGEDAGRKNILFIAVDDLRPVLGCYGHQTVISPHMDQLARSGTRFSRAYCQVAVCNPSRASVLTGLRPDALRLWTNKPHFREHRPDVVTLPQLFRQQGYAAREIGKIFHDPASHKDSLSWSGPSQYAVTRNGQGHKYALPANYTPQRSKGAASEQADVPDTAYIDGKVAAAAMEVLREIQDSAFFLAVGFRRPHLPFSAPKRYWDLYDPQEIHQEYKSTPAPVGAPEIAFHDSNELRGYEDIPAEDTIPRAKQVELLHAYYASISYVDAQIGKLLRELTELGLSDNTLVVLWSDHGFHLGDFGMWCKATNFEAATRVPLILSGPGIAKGQVDPTIVELVDIYPTLATWANLPLPADLAGDNLFAIPGNRAEFALSQFVRPYQAINSREPGTMGYSIRTDEYRYTEWRNFPDMTVLERELYQLSGTETETQNLAGKQAYATVMNRLADQMNAANPTMPISQNKDR
ncbi:sulfatase [Flavilitoribacter nigricans]|nr:sulfatase [Flavilitoribacter nigricans]